MFLYHFHLFLFVMLLFALVTFPAMAAEPIKIGEIYPYSALPDDAKNWRQGWELALEEINRDGGISGRPLEVLSRDDKGNPADAVRALEDLKTRERINVLIGTLHSHVGLAASSFAHRNGMLMFRGAGGTTKLIGEAGHDFYFQIQTSSKVWAGSMADKALESRKKRWAFVAADYELSRSVIAEFQKMLKAGNPEVEFVETQWFPIGKIDAGAIAQVVAHAKPDGLFVIVFGSDYLRFVREGNKRGLFDNRFVMGPFAGYASYVRPLGKEAPVGWYSVYGYPVDDVADEKHKKFVASYRAKYSEKPYIQSLYAYNTLNILAQALRAVGSDDPDKLATYIRKTSFDLPGGDYYFREDGMSNRGEWVGFTGFDKEGVPGIVDPIYIPPDKYLPSVEENLAKRKK